MCAASDAGNRMVTCSILREVMLGEIMPDLNVKDQGMSEEAFLR